MFVDENGFYPRRTPAPRICGLCEHWQVIQGGGTTGLCRYAARNDLDPETCFDDTCDAFEEISHDE